MAQTQQNKKYIQQVHITYTLGQGVIVSADFQSKSRPGITHYARIIIDPIDFTVTKASCDCEGFTFKRKCWHIQTLKEITFTELKEEVEKMAKEELEVEGDIASWG
jgi:hypothetical protein